MIASVIVIGVVLGLAYAFMMRGFFNAFMNMICAVTAGAIAFGLWETTAHALMAAMPRSFIFDGAYGLGLALPFGVSFAILRAITDKLIGANVKCGLIGDHLGGAVCGAVAGVISAGIFFLSLGFLRMDPDLGLGYQRIDYATQGNLKRNPGLWLPADQIVARLYGHMSETALRTSTPLSRMYPNLDEVPAALRITGSARIRNVMDPADIKLLKRYTLDAGAGAKLDAILEDSWNPKSQIVQDLNGENFPAGSKLEGFVVNFGSNAKEAFGQTVVGAPQVRLVVEDDSGSRQAMHPVAVICQGQASDVAFGRFRFDQRDIFVGSVGGASEVRMGFDFVVPPGYNPILLYVKNARIDLEAEDSPKPEKFTSAAARDAAVRSGSIIGVKAAGNLDTGEATKVSTRAQGGSDAADGLDVSNTIGLVIQRGTQGGLEISPDGPYVRDGENIFDKKQFSGGGAMERNLRVDRFEVSSDTAIVKVDVSAGKATSLLGRAAQSAESVVPPVLVDDKNQQFEAIGYIYQDKDKVVIRYTPGRPIRGLAELDQQKVGLSRSRSDQTLTLVFRVSTGVKIRAFAFGSKVVTEFNPPVTVEGQR
jgi:hypothetical protein